MALKITRETDLIRVNQLAVVIYAPPGIGKTTLAFTADAPLLLDFDKGSYRAKNRRDSVQVDNWQDVANMDGSDLAPYSTVIVDTAGRCLDALSADIIRRDPKKGRGGALTLQGYGSLKSEFIAWTKHLRSFGLDVVLLAHSDEQHKGDDIIERLDVQGGSKNEIYKSADAMARLGIINGKRILNFSPTDTAFGKNPANLEPLEVPNYATAPTFLADVIQRTKDALNELSEAQQEVAALQAQWADKVAAAESVDDFNKLVKEATEADERVQGAAKRMVFDAGTKKGFEFDAKAKKFASKEAA